MTKLRVLRTVMLVLALLLLVRLVAHLGPSRIVEQLAAVGSQFGWLVVIYGAGTTIGALPWYVLLRADDRPSLGAAIASRFAASGANAVIPLLGFGGEPVRLMWLRPAQRAAGTAAIILDRLTYGFASGLFLVAGACAAIWLTALPRAYVMGAVVAATCLLGGIAIVIAVLARGTIAARVHRLVRRIASRSGSEGPLFGERVDRELGTMLERRRSLLLAVALGVLARVALGAEIYAGFHIFGVSLSPAEALVFASVPVLLAFVGALVPSQLGVHEGAQALVAASVGISPTTAVAVVLLLRLRQLAGAAIVGVLLLVRRGKLMPATEPALAQPAT